MHRILSVALGVALLSITMSPAADAQSAREMRQEVEASMLVTGHVDIDRSGQVTAHVIDQPDKLPPYVVGLIERAMPSLRFEPVLVDGQPVLARAKMGLRMVVTPAESGEMHLRIASAHFGEEYSPTDTSSVRADRMAPPRYPDSVLQMGGKGTVYLLVRVGRDGATTDVAVEQVNLTALGSAREMQRIREGLSRAAVAQARKWTFIPPTEGEEASRDDWVIRVPVDFAFFGDRAAAYGKWNAYHPGARNTPVWAGPMAPGFSPDALAEGGITPSTSRFKLVTPLEG